ncbi:hypothetical protein HRbin06_00797 [archaeon HR06]|nr:hypothetical protein HRbin06_00797 [archaeon HR06]
MESNTPYIIAKELGFTNSEAKVIEALYHLEEATVLQIYHRTKLDKAEIYRTLDKLNSKGIVEIILDFPKKYKLVPLNEVFKRKLREEEDRIKRLNEKLSTLLLELSPSLSKTDNIITDKFEFISGGDNIIKLQYKLLKNCKKVVRSVLDVYGPFRTIGYTKSIVSEVIKRGIEVRYLLPVDSINYEQVKELIKIGIDVRNLKDIKSRIMMVDNTDSLLITSNTFIPRYSKDDKALWIRSTILTQTLVQMFDFIYERAEKVI